MRLKNIEFIFENCEVINIDGKYIGDFLVDDITTSIMRTACNCIQKCDIVHTIAIEIHKDANKEYNPFGQMQIEKTVFDRLNDCYDITSIEFTLEEQCDGKLKDTTYSYYVDWTGNSQYSNKAQITYQSETGHCYILIKDKAQLDDYFDMDLIDNPESIKFHFSMMDIGGDEN